VITTIHQPSSESFLEFDRLLLMSDGYCVYQGDAKMSAQYFRDLKFRLPTFSNPADTYMRILAVNFPKTEKDERKLSFFNSNYDQKLKPFVESECKMIALPEPNLDELKTSGVSMMVQFL
jgi:ABC-type multidrug transport system ATPase subunit